MSLFSTLLNHDFTVRRRTRTNAGHGRWPIGYEDIGTVRGRLRPASSGERQVAAQEGRQITHVFYCEAGADIARGDELDGADKTVEVLGVRNPSQAGHHLEIDCLEQQGEATTEAGS